MRACAATRICNGGSSASAAGEKTCSRFSCANAEPRRSARTTTALIGVPKISFSFALAACLAGTLATYRRSRQYCERSRIRLGLCRRAGVLQRCWFTGRHVSSYRRDCDQSPGQRGNGRSARYDSDVSSIGRRRRCSRGVSRPRSSGVRIVRGAPARVRQSVQPLLGSEARARHLELSDHARHESRQRHGRDDRRSGRALAASWAASRCSASSSM